MKTIIVAALTALGLAVSAGAASAQYGGYGSGSNPSSHYTQGYSRQDGTYVGGHYSTNPNNTQRDNYGTSGNYNPYSGAYGNRAPRY